MIGANRQYYSRVIRNYYVALQSNERGKPENNNLMSSTLTVNNMINENKQFYKPAQIEEQQEDEEEKVDQNLPFYILALSKTSIPQMQYIGLLYNSNTIFDKNCEQIEDAKILDEVRRKRRQIKLVGSSNHDEQPKQESVKKKYKRLYKNYIAKLSFNIPDNLKLVSKDLDANKSWTKILKLQEFGNKCPSLSIAQEKVTGRFYIYDNSCGKVHIYSSEILINSNKDRPLVSLSLNEEIPRQNPILYLVECEHEFQWKSVLFVIGGFHKQKSKKVRPLRSIKVFEIKRREVTLTPAITINMQYPRMSPIVFDLAKDQGLLWQQADTKLLGSKSIDSRYIFFMGGNPLLEFEKEVDPQLKAANQTTEYIQLKKVLDHINRASQFTSHDQYEIQGINFSKLEIVDTLNIKYQNNPISEKIYNHLHHAAIAKINDDVLESKYHVIIGGDRSEAIQLQSIQQQFNEINFIGSKYQLQRPTKIWSANNIGYYQLLLDNSMNYTTMMKVMIQSQQYCKTWIAGVGLAENNLVLVQFNDNTIQIIIIKKSQMGKGKHQSRSPSEKKKKKEKSRDREKGKMKEKEKEKSIEKERERKERPKVSGFSQPDQTRASKWGVANDVKVGSTEENLKNMYSNPKTSATPQVVQAVYFPPSYQLPTPIQYTFVPGMNQTIIKMLNDPTKIRRKIKVPPDPSFNYIGLIIGPKGVSQKKLEEETGAKILVRGRGSQKEGQPPQPDDDEDLHVLVVAETPQQAANACDKIERILLADAEELQRYRQEQMKLIASSQQGPVVGGATQATPVTQSNIDPNDLSMTTPYGPPSKDAYVYPVPNEYVGLVIGVKGETIQMLKEKSGCRNVQVAADSAPGASSRNVFIVGDPDAVERCQQMLQEIVDTQRKVRTAPGAKKIEFQVHDQFVALIIGKKGVTIKSISERSGAFVAITQSPEYPVRPDHKAFVLSGTEDQLNIAIVEIEQLLDGAKKAYFSKTGVDPSTINIPTPYLIQPENALSKYQIEPHEPAPMKQPEFKTPEEQAAYIKQQQIQAFYMQYHMMQPASQPVVEERIISSRK